MNRWSASLALAGMAVLLSACVYYPNGPYGPGYGPYRSGYDRPPPGPGYNGSPPPQQQGYGSPPQQQQSYAPPPQQGYAQQGPDSGQQGPSSQGPNQRQIAHMNDPNWCSAHARRCQMLQSRFGQAGQQGPSGGAQDGPPPQGPNDGPPPQE